MVSIAFPLLLGFAVWLWFVAILAAFRWDRGVLEWEFFCIIYAMAAVYTPAAVLASRLWAYPLGREVLWLLLGFEAFFLGLMAWICAYPLLTPRPKGSEKWLLVLGAPVYRGRPTPNLTSRAAGAAKWLLAHPDCTAILSGGTKDRCSEASIMAEEIRSRCPDAKLLPEDRSTTTNENFDFTRQLLIQRGESVGEDIIIVTNRFHIYRMHLYAKRWGFGSARYLPLPTPAGAAPIWYTREVIVTVRYWLLGL